MTPETPLRHLLPTDYLCVRDYVCNPEVSKYLTWRAYTQEEEVKKYFNEALSKTSCPDEVLGIQYHAQIIGTVHLIMRKDECIQLGFGIMPEFWHQGIGQKVLEEILNYIKTSEWLQRSQEIWADINQQNKRAISLFQRNGFVLRRENIEPERDRFILKLQ